MAGAAAVFLDRDGVLNRAIVKGGQPYPPGRVEEVMIFPGILSALKRLDEAGYVLVGVTNQPDVARGTQSRQTVEAINAVLISQLPLREIFVCYHDDLDGCKCRKPKPGLIFQAAEKYGLDLARSWMVGDRWKDIAAGHAAGLKTIFVDDHYAEAYCGPRPDFSVQDIGSIADIILVVAG